MFCMSSATWFTHTQKCICRSWNTRYLFLMQMIQTFATSLALVQKLLVKKTKHIYKQIYIWFVLIKVTKAAKCQALHYTPYPYSVHSIRILCMHKCTVFPCCSVATHPFVFNSYMMEELPLTAKPAYVSQYYDHAQTQRTQNRNSVHSFWPTERTQPPETKCFLQQLRR